MSGMSTGFWEFLWLRFAPSLEGELFPPKIQLADTRLRVELHGHSYATKREPDSMNSMNYQLLGRSGLRVSDFCLGTMTFGQDWGWGAPKEEAKNLRRLPRTHRCLLRQPC